MALLPSTERRRAALRNGQEALWKLELVRDHAGQLAPLRIWRPHPASGPVVTNVPRSLTLKLPVAVMSEIVHTDSPKPIPKPHEKPVKMDEEEYWVPTNPTIVITAAEPTPLLSTNPKWHPTGELYPSDNDKPPNYGRASMPSPDWKRTKTFITTLQDPAPPLSERCCFSSSQAPNERYRYQNAHSIVPFANTKPIQLDSATIEREIIRFSKPGYKLLTSELYHFQQIYNYLARACIRMIKAGDRVRTASDHSAGWAYLEPKMKKQSGQKFWVDKSPLVNIHTYASMEIDPWPDAHEAQLQKEFEMTIMEEQRVIENMSKKENYDRYLRRLKNKKGQIKKSGLSVLMHWKL